MAKQSKQKNRLGLKRRIRKTLGALSLASALAVAAIPVDTLEAVENLANDVEKVVLTEEDSRIPEVNEATDPIYTTGDGVYRFGYVYPKTAESGEKVAVILKYNPNMDVNVGSGVLTIPDTFDAYKEYDPGTGSGTGNVAVNMNGQYLFYMIETPVLDEYGNPTYGQYQVDAETGEFLYDDKGDKIPVESTLITTKEVNPCYYRTYDTWSSHALYILKPGATLGSTEYSDYQRVAAGSNDERLKGIKVQYINNAPEGGNGIFEETGSIVTLEIGEYMQGIGDRAFYGCTSIQSVTVDAKIDTIGNYAFTDCIKMQNFNIPSNTNVRIIGEHAFSNCQSLLSFPVPVSVEKLGDYCFEGCRSLTTVDLNAGGASRLKNLGNHLFVNCKSLSELVIPLSVSETLDISMFEGCDALKHVTVLNPAATFTEGLPSVNDRGTAYSIEKFKDTVSEEFYFEGEENSAIHKLCGSYAIAFKYLNKDLYEIIIHEVEGDLTSPKATYKVNEANELVVCDIEKGMEVVDMPQAIGPAKIQTISSTSFQNNCFLEKIYIPSSVIRIEGNAFMGCHHLKDVIFREPLSLTSIGANAFQTQQVTRHNANCPDTTLADVPELTFTGPISYESEPFRYAMEPASSINVGDQPKTYIKYYSGWPSNLTVQYDSEKGNTLIDYPTIATLTTDYSDMPYLTDSQSKALNSAYKNLSSGAKLTQDEEDLIDAVLNIELPRGIEAVEDGLFVEKETNSSESTFLNKLGLGKTLTTRSINEILPNTFEGCTNVESVLIDGETFKIGDYAFKDCTRLVNVEISSQVSELGLRPFAGCDRLNSISFQGGEYFTCDNAIIYSLTNGAKSGIVECLESRGKTTGSTSVEAEELVGVKTIAQEAFMDCENVGSVNMTASQIGEIPVDAFRNTTGLYSVYIGDACGLIWDGAFRNSGVRQLEIPSGVSYIDPEAFDTTANATDYNQITFVTPEDSNAAKYAKVYENINITPKKEQIIYEVTFQTQRIVDSKPVIEILESRQVAEGEDAIPPAAPEYEGYVFLEWSPYEAIAGNVTITAYYQPIDPETQMLTVEFYDYYNNLITTKKVEKGGTVEPPTTWETYEVEGWKFDGWKPALTNITENTKISAFYVKIDSSEYLIKVTFKDGDRVIDEVMIQPGEQVELPSKDKVEKEGYVFNGWNPSDLSNVTSDLTVYADYDKIDSSTLEYTVNFYVDKGLYKTVRVDPGEDAYVPEPKKEGYVFVEWYPEVTNVQKDIETYAQFEKIIPTPTPEPTVTATPTPSDPSVTPAPTAVPTPAPTPVTFYTLTVRNGSGSGSYPAGSRVIIIADDPASGQEFSNWTVDPTDTVLASKYVTATVIDMPAKDVLVTANYKAKPSSGVVGSGGTGNSSSGSGSAGNVGGTSGSGNSGSTSTNGTTVVINKNGLSNTGVVAVQVNGSSDNFVLKISENATATEEALRALMGKYSDLSNIVYFPMDISLYDSTGTKQITDTTGLSINITIPIPDSMITYAGNNKIAAVVNGSLQDLTPTFKTISGVSCISFTATKFTPYVIYVDTDNLGASVIVDSTPKTGDGIHPKWFLSIGLLCISMVLFLKKDKVTKTNDKKMKMA